jgi:hypothetical protein
MGVEVDWRDVKKICPPSSNLGTFLGAMFHFIKEIGKEHMEHLIKTGRPMHSSGHLLSARRISPT